MNGKGVERKTYGSNWLNLQCQSLQGEPTEVAEAVFEAALPRTAGDLLPRSQAGIVVAVADRLDSLVGLGGDVGAGRRFELSCICKMGLGG